MRFLVSIESRIRHIPLPFVGGFHDKWRCAPVGFISCSDVVTHPGKTLHDPAAVSAQAISGLARAGFVDASQGAIWGLGLWLMVMLGYAVGQQKKRWGVWLGSVLQAPLILGYFIDPAIAIIGVMFLALWITALRLGGRIDRERAERVTAERLTSEQLTAEHLAEPESVAPDSGPESKA